MSWQLGKKNVMRKKELIIFLSKRWKIDNQGFNHQKIKLYQIENITKNIYSSELYQCHKLKGLDKKEKMN